MTAIADSEFRCEICGAVLADAAELATHREAHEERAAEGLPSTTVGPTLHCAVCQESFGTPEAVKEHHRSAHGM